MTMTVHQLESMRVAEVLGEGILLRETRDALDLLADAHYHHECDGLVLHVENIDPAFFDLRSGMAGELLQKFTNYGARVGILGDISAHTAGSKALRDFVRESNRRGQVLFADSLEAVLAGMGGA